MNMNPKQSRGNDSKAVVPQKSINRKHLAEFFGVSVKSLIFAIAETPDGNGGVTVTPVIAVLGAQEFISLLKGKMHSIGKVQGFKQTLYPAIVLYKKETDEFQFKSSVRGSAMISADTLVEHFGLNVIDRFILI